MFKVVAADRPVFFDCLDDEELVFFCQRAGVERARGILAARHLNAVYHLLEWLFRRHGLKSAEREDARQAAVLWFVEAIESFDVRRLETHPSLTFRTHWRLIVRLRFIDFVRRLRREERRIDRSSQAQTWLEHAPERILSRAWTDPAEERVAWEDCVRCVREILTERADLEQRLWTLLTEGVSLRHAAVALNVSYDAAKRCRRRMLAALTRRMRRET